MLISILVLQPIYSDAFPLAILKEKFGMSVLIKRSLVSFQILMIYNILLLLTLHSQCRTPCWKILKPISQISINYVPRHQFIIEY